MWKRLNNQRSSRHPTISGPVLNEPRPVENAYDGGFEGSGLDVNRAQASDRGRPPPRPPRHDSKGLPRLPFIALPSGREFHDSDSSVYSQLTPKPTTTHFPPQAYSNPAYYGDQVSPPSSPELALMRKGHVQIEDRDVSPVDETPDVSRLPFGRLNSRMDSKPPSTGIPIFRKERRRKQVSQAASNVVTRKEVGDNTPRGKIPPDVQWDPYSQEISATQRGELRSVKTGDPVRPGLRSHGSAGVALGDDLSVGRAPKHQKSFGERVRNLKLSASERQEWKGASGRAKVVAPVQDQLDVTPTNKSSQNNSRRLTSPYASPSPVRPALAIRSISYDTSPASARLTDYFDPSVGTEVSNDDFSSLQVDHSSVMDSDAESEEDFDDAQQYQSQDYSKYESSGTIERNLREAFKNIGYSPQNLEEPYIQPPSRFSVTTYAPSELSVPRRSIDSYDRPPVTPSPQEHVTTLQPSPILNRKRPKVMESPKFIAVKAVPSSPVVINMASSIISRRPISTSKELPQSPAEAEAAQSLDLVSTLEAQLESLALRRNNITKSIRQMTELMPTDRVLMNEEVLRKRELEKIRVESLREEEADVRRLEHDIGLRLHRAYKRRDKNAEYEPTGLWVRRVTG